MLKSKFHAGTVYVSSDPEADVKAAMLHGHSTILKMEKVCHSHWSLSRLRLLILAAVQPSLHILRLAPLLQLVSLKLAITKTTPEERVLIGSGVPWDITVTNVGDFCAYDVVVTDSLPAGVTTPAVRRPHS